jgi:hypothetical protein
LNGVWPFWLSCAHVREVHAPFTPPSPSPVLHHGRNRLITRTRYVSTNILLLLVLVLASPLMVSRAQEVPELMINSERYIACVFSGKQTASL